jgi:Ca-activated chloride channel family protein
VLVLDASNSMLVEDVRPNRLELERALARDFLRRVEGSRVAIVVFAGSGYVVAPLTRDYDALDAYLEALAPEMVPQGGSSLSNAVRQGAALLLGAPGERARGALVVMTDGDALEEARDIELAASLLARAGVPLHIVGIGTRAGGPVPDVDPRTGRRVGYKRDLDGSIARSALGEPLLQRLAEVTRGSYRHIRAVSPAELAGAVNTVRPGGPDWTQVRPGNRYEWFLGAALALLALDSVLEAGILRRRKEEGPPPPDPLPRKQRGRGGDSHGSPRLGMLLPVGLFLLGGCRETPHARYRRGEVKPAAEAYARAVQGGDTSAVARYNLGTALLRLRSFDEARPMLEGAAGVPGAPRPLRQRAHYNTGNTELEPALADTSKSEERTARLRRAVAQYKRALLINPADGDAKWNLELALRLLAESPQSGGGGGGGGQDQAGGGEDDDEQAPQPAPGPPQTTRSSAGTGDPDLSPSAAERILSAAERDERELQRRKLRQTPPGERAERDW